MTGASSGVGKELTRILYSRNATVYLVGRSASRSLDTTSEIKSGFPDSKGNLIFIKADFEDLVSVKNGAKLFLQKEERLDGLWNNAGVMLPEPGNRTKQGYELQLGTNTLGPFLFSRLLTPILISTAKERKPGEVRIMWVASSAAELFTPKGGIDIENLDYKKDVSNTQKYGISKAGMILLNQEFARRHRVNGIISVVCQINPSPGPLLTRDIGNEPWKHQDKSSQTFTLVYCNYLWLDKSRPNKGGIYRAVCWVFTGNKNDELWMLGYVLRYYCGRCGRTLIVLK